MSQAYPANRGAYREALHNSMSATVDESGFKLGQHDARLTALEDNVKEVKEDLKTVLEILQRGKGSWKTLVWLGGAVGVLVEISHQIASFLHGK